MSNNNFCLVLQCLGIVLFWSCWLVSWPCIGLGDDVLALVSVLRGDVWALSWSWGCCLVNITGLSICE